MAGDVMNIIQATLRKDSRRMKPHSIPRMRGAFFTRTLARLEGEGEGNHGEMPLEAINQGHPDVNNKGCARQPCLLRRREGDGGGGEGEVLCEVMANALHASKVRCRYRTERREVCPTAAAGEVGRQV